MFSPPLDPPVEVPDAADLDTRFLGQKMDVQAPFPLRGFIALEHIDEHHPQIGPGPDDHITNPAEQIGDLLTPPRHPLRFDLARQKRVAFGESVRSFRVHGHDDACLLLEQPDGVVVVAAAQRHEPEGRGSY